MNARGQIRFWVSLGRRYECPASSTTSFLPCDKWVRCFITAITRDLCTTSADLSVEGIFRKNGNIRRLKDLADAIDRDPLSVDLTQDNAVQLAALLKKFLRDLPEPLLTTKLHRVFVASQSERHMIFPCHSDSRLCPSDVLGGRPQTFSPLHFAHPSKTEPGHHGGAVCILEVGCFIRACG